MVQINPVTVRIKFFKRGALQYISHLDLVRTMNKIIVRARLPLWYSEGFNPKPKMVFAAPLSIGTESECEFMDLRLTERLSEEEIKAALNRNLTDEMQVTEVYYPDTKLTELKWFSYKMEIKTEGSSSELAEIVNDCLKASIIEVSKKTKPGEPTKTVNIAPLIKSAEARYLPDSSAIEISSILSADQSCFLNPEYVISALKEKAGVLSGGNLLKEYYSIKRERSYCADMTEFR